MTAGTRLLILIAFAAADITVDALCRAVAGKFRFPIRTIFVPRCKGAGSRPGRGRPDRFLFGSASIEMAGSRAPLSLHTRIHSPPKKAVPLYATRSPKPSRVASHCR